MQQQQQSQFAENFEDLTLGEETRMDIQEDIPLGISRTTPTANPPETNWGPGRLHQGPKSPRRPRHYFLRTGSTNRYFNHQKIFPNSWIPSGRLWQCRTTERDGQCFPTCGGPVPWSSIHTYIHTYIHTCVNKWSWTSCMAQLFSLK